MVYWNRKKKYQSRNSPHQYTKALGKRKRTVSPMWRCGASILWHAKRALYHLPTFLFQYICANNAHEEIFSFYSRLHFGLGSSPLSLRYSMATKPCLIVHGKATILRVCMLVQSLFKCSCILLSSE